LAQLRREDVAASRAVNANTYAAINRLAAKLDDIKDNSQPQTLAAVNRLAATLQELRSADKQHEPQTLAAITRLTNTLTQLRDADSSREPKVLEEINRLSGTLSTLREQNAQRADRHTKEAAEDRRLRAEVEHRRTSRALQDARSNEQRTFGVLTELANAVRELRDADASRSQSEAEHVQASEERAQAAINQLSSVAQELRAANQNNADINNVIAGFEANLRTVRSEISQNRSSDSQHVQALGSLERLIATMHDQRVGGNPTPPDNAQLIEPMRQFVQVQTAPRVVVRDSTGRITGVRVELLKAQLARAVRGF